MMAIRLKRWQSEWGALPPETGRKGNSFPASAGGWHGLSQQLVLLLECVLYLTVFKFIFSYTYNAYVYIV